MYTDFQLDLLKRKNIILAIDGTFKLVPRLFKQLLTVHIQFGYRTYPVMFFLCPNKECAMYQTCFNYLKEKSNCDLKFALMDFESSMRNGFNNVFGPGKIRGCIFHLTSNIIKRIKKNQLGKSYNSNPDVNIWIRTFMALPFTTKEEIDIAFQELEKEIYKFEPDIQERLKSFYTSFVSTYHYGKPFSHADYCLLDSIYRRSNNGAEAWNSLHSRLYRGCHPNLFVFIKK